MLKNKFIYFVLLTVSAAFCFLYEDYLSFLLLVVVVTLPFLLAGILYWTKYCLRVNLNIPRTVANRGEEIELRFQVENQSIFPISCAKLTVVYQNQFYDKKRRETIAFSLQAKQRGELVKKLRSDRCGSIAVRVEAVKVYDLLKLFGVKKKLEQEEAIAVLPPISPLEGVVSADSAVMMESEHYSKTEGGDDPSEVFDIREYREGDRLQRIHWKLSLKQDAYMVKEFSLPGGQSMLILVELYRGGDIDAVLEALISLSYFMLSRQITHGIKWYDIKNDAYREMNVAVAEDLFSAVREMFETVPCEKSISVLQMYSVMPFEEYYSHLFCISAGIPAVDEGVWESLLAAADALTLISAVNNETSEQLQHTKQLLDTLGVRMYSIREGNVKECLEPLVL